MRILILSNDDGGLYHFRKELIEELVKYYKVICAVPNHEGYIDKLKSLGCKCVVININRRGTNPIEDLRLIRRYIRLIKRVKPDIVLTYTIKPNVYGGIVCRITKEPYIANVTGLGTSIQNGGILSKIALTLYRIGLRNASCVFFQNKANKDTFLRKKIIQGNSKVIPGSGVNLEDHCMESYPEDADDGTIRFLFVGRIMKDKGIEELLTAVRLLNKVGKRIILDVVGGRDEDYTDKLRKYEQHNLIKYHGQQNDVHKFYKQAHCIVLPSYHEGMANVLLEAAATGRPVIASRIPGCQETFDEGITGIGCEPKDVESLKQAMSKMYELSNDKRKEMGIAGRRKMENEFDRRTIIDAYMEEIRNVI